MKKLFFLLALCVSVPSLIYSKSNIDQPQLKITENERTTFDKKTGNYWVKSSKGEIFIFEPGTKLTATLFSKTQRDTATGELSFDYELLNNPSSRQKLINLKIEKRSDAILYSPEEYRMPPKTSKILKYKYVGRSVYELNKNSEFGSYGQLPGQRISGFGLRSQALPGIVFTEIMGYSPVQKGREDEDVWYGFKIEDDFVSGRTVGPTDDYLGKNASQFIEYLINLREEAVKEKWISDPKISGEIIDHLWAIQKNIQNSAEAKRLVEGFLTYLQGLKIDDKTFSSEAYALMYFNAKYLNEKLL